MGVALLIAPAQGQRASADMAIVVGGQGGGAEIQVGMGPVSVFGRAEGFLSIDEIRTVGLRVRLFDDEVGRVYASAGAGKAQCSEKGILEPSGCAGEWKNVLVAGAGVEVSLARRWGLFMEAAGVHTSEPSPEIANWMFGAGVRLRLLEH